MDSRSALSAQQAADFAGRMRAMAILLEPQGDDATIVSPQDAGSIVAQAAADLIREAIGEYWTPAAGATLEGFARALGESLFWHFEQKRQWAARGQRQEGRP